jgi:hypothetical protein
MNFEIFSLKKKKKKKKKKRKRKRREHIAVLQTRFNK